MKIVHVKDGDTIEFLPEYSHRIICCDCGLAHDFILTNKTKKKVEFVVTRNERSTAQLRRNSKKWGFTCFPKEDK